MNENFQFSLFPVDNKTIPLIGRDDEIFRIKQYILDGCNISILGDRKIGKSSILKTLKNDFSDIKYVNKIIPVYIDFQYFAYDITGEKVLNKILSRVYRSCNIIYTEFKDCSYGKADEFSEVVEFCNVESIIILLLLDNFDLIPILKKLDNAFWTHLRGNAESKELSIVTASRSSIETLCHKGDLANSHFWNNFNPIISISVFDDIQSARNILSRGITNEKNKDLIISLVGVHPFFLKIAANALIESKLSASVDEKAITAIIYEKIKPFYEDCFKLLRNDDDIIDNGVHYKLEYVSILNSICSSNINKDIKEKRGYNKLKEFGYIQTNPEGYPEIPSPLFARYLKEQYNFDKKPESYIGTEPYIFVSYAHADTEIVFPIIEKLQKLGYRIWYDYGIPTSAKWKKEIEERIEKCNKFIFFMSRTSSSSYEVNTEIQKFIEYCGRGKYNRDFIMILLDDIKLCKNENTCESVDFVISDCNGVHISKEDDSYFIKVINKLGIECGVLK